jgi:hypothetical protein
LDFGTLVLVSALLLAIVIALVISAFGEWRERDRDD